MNKSILNRILESTGLGIIVRRPVAVDLTGWTTIFTIAGGPVLVTLLLTVRTIIQGGGASNIRFQHSIGPTPWCAVTATTATDAVNTMYTITGNFADAATYGAAGASILGGIAGGLLATGNQGKGIIALPGNVQVQFSAVAPTGSSEYYLAYKPIAGGVVAA